MMKTTPWYSGEFRPDAVQQIDLQHINIKMLLRDSQDLELDPVIPIFHSWIQQQVGEELLLDVADYRHVHGGPGIVLIGHEADYSLDHTDNRLGIRYNRKAVVAGSNQDRLIQAAQATLSACQRLQADTRLNGRLNFNGREIEIFINDRLLAPNREETREALRAEFEAFSAKLFGEVEYSLSFGSESSFADPRRLLGVSLAAARPVAVEDLQENLRSSAVDLAKHGPSRAAGYDWRVNQALNPDQGECAG